VAARDIQSSATINPAEWFVYEHTVEGLFFRALRTRLTPSMQGRLKELGIDVNGKPKSVQHAQWVQAIHLAATELFEGPPDERFRQLGRTVMLRHDETVMGKAVIAVMKLMGPRRVLGRINSTLRSGNNYIQANLAPIGPTTWEGTVNECNGNPHYIAGVVEQGLIISGGVGVKVDVSGFDGHSAKFLINWG
jgi:uncharacterized protein (TIGR02265 family)